MNKKAIFFTIDALISLIIILFAVLVIYPAIRPRLYESELSGDIIKVLSSLKIGEIQSNPVVEQLKSDGKITDYNKTILEQIGEFYVTDKPNAKDLADSVLSTIDERENIGIWYGSELIASRNITSMEKASNVEVDKQIISGIQHGSTLTGFSAIAFLTSSLQKKYFYFGGYTGDGNISVNVSYTGNLIGLDLEVAANTNFSFCVNSITEPPCCGSAFFEPSASQFEPKNFSLYDGYELCFHPGSNIIKFYGTKKRLFFAGGFIKIIYNQSAVYEQANKYYFPGIEGLINIYDGFYVPGTLTDMEVFLHYNSNYTMFLNIGNVTVFKEKSGNEAWTTINDATLKSKLDYTSLSNKTTPLKLGLENVSVEVLSNADIFSVAELSGSVMQMVYGKKMLTRIQEGNEIFVTTVLNASNNRVGLVAYSADANDETRNHNLSTNIISLNNTIYSWSQGGPTCVCCGINKAVEKFLASWNASRYHAILIMSDGKANNDCGSGDALNDAIQAACNAYNNYGIKVNVIGYGPTTTIDEVTLKAMATCGHGNYYYSNATELSEKYREAAKDIIQAAYQEQTIVLAGSAFTKLYPDSYIKFNYIKETLPYGLITTNENQFVNDYTGSFSVPSDSQILETKVISYSGPRWTDSVKMDGSSVYKLSNYGINYTELGDPYAINIPNSLIIPDNSYTINVTTATSPTNISAGSRFNKIIYTLAKELPSYSNIASTANGCIWNIEFSSGPQINDLKIPETATDTCYYNSTARYIEEHGSIINCGGTPDPCKGEGASPVDDAVKIAVYSLLKSLDYDLDGKLDVNFAEQDLQIDYSDITGIPYPYSTEVQVRKWD